MKTIKIYRSGIHMGEERLIQGNDASGMIVFSGCHLRCQFCYTPETSRAKQGFFYDPHEFGTLLRELVRRGARNINLISPSHVWLAIRGELFSFRESFYGKIPIILKVSGYESERVAQDMSSLADVIVPDFKVWNKAVALENTLPPNYGPTSLNALRIWMRSHNPPQFMDERMVRGLLVRHLVMPRYSEDSKSVLLALQTLQYRGPLNLMTNFINTGQGILENPPREAVSDLVQMCVEFGMQPMVNGRFCAAS